MTNYFKGCALTLFVVFLVVLAGGLIFNDADNAGINVYVENNTVSCEISSFSTGNDAIETEICDYVLTEMNNPESDVETIKEGISDIGRKNGLDNVNVKLDSPLGENKIPIIFTVDGKSMVPTLQDGQSITVEKTHDISVNDVVVADSDEYGIIVKRVDKINGNSVYLISDNKNVEYSEINGVLYETKGITTWVSISDIYGPVIDL